MGYETLKAEMNLCAGERAGYGFACRGTLYKCTCGNVGCKQTKDGGCTNQGFTVLGRCLKCGAIGQLEALQ